MHARNLATTIAVGLVLVSAPVLGGDTPKIKASGVASFDDAGGSTRHGKFHLKANATGPGVIEEVGTASDSITTYQARVDVEFNILNEVGPDKILHVFGDGCIADWGSTYQDVWEIRGSFGQGGTDGYRSVFVRDGGRSDYLVSEYDIVYIDDPSCGLVEPGAVERLTKGHVNVKD